MAKTIKAIFTGKNSRGFQHGKLYELTSAIETTSATKAYIVVRDCHSSNWCPYESLNSFLENWEV